MTAQSGRPCVSRPDVLGGTVAGVSAVLHSCLKWRFAEVQHDCPFFFFTVFVLARRQPGNVTLSFHFECDKESGRGAEKDLTLGAAEVHAVRLEWGGEGVGGGGFREGDGGA